MANVITYSDTEILQAVREDSVAGWTLFCTQFDPLIRAITNWKKWNLSEHEKQDVQQNIYIQLQKALPTFRQQCSLTCFIKTVAIRQCIDEIRRQVRWRTFITTSMQKTSDGEWNEMDFENPDALAPDQEIIQKERWQCLQMAMQQLSETCKTSIQLFYVNELSYQEISKRLGIATNTVGSRLAKCLNKLHTELKRNPAFKRSHS